MYQEKLSALRAFLSAQKVAGIVLTTIDNVYWASGYRSVMDGWSLPEPLAGVFVPTAPEKPVTLLLPEASLIGLVVSAREGYPVHYDQIACFDLLNFCQTARAEDAYLQLSDDITSALQALSHAVIGPCTPDMIAGLEQTLRQASGIRGPILFDDMRMATRMAQTMSLDIGDGYDVMFQARVIKTKDELEVFRASGRKADKVMDFTVSQLGIGTKWCDVEKAVAHFMIDEDIDPLPSSPMLFGGSYDLAFRPDLFRTHFDQPFTAGQIAILETQGRYKNVWIDINRTAHMGQPSAEYIEQHAIVQQCFTEIAGQLLPGNNTAEICRAVQETTAQNLDAPGKLQLIIHSIGHVPLENPTPFPMMGLASAVNGFTIQENMVLSFDCLYFGSKLGPSHMENVFIISQNDSASIYNYPLDLIIA